MSQASTPLFTVRHLAIARALAAALAAVMITFSPDHTSTVGLAVFGGFTMFTAIIWFVSIWLVFRSGDRWQAIFMTAFSFAAGVLSGMPGLRSPVFMVVVFVCWAALSGLIELIWGLRLRRTDRGESRDHILLGGLGFLFAIATLLVPIGYELPYTVTDRDPSVPAFHGVLTGEIIAVGIFGAYAAFVAVFTAISGLSPQQKQSVTADAADADSTGAAPADAPTGKADA